MPGRATHPGSLRAIQFEHRSGRGRAKIQASMMRLGDRARDGQPEAETLTVRAASPRTKRWNRSGIHGRGRFSHGDELVLLRLETVAQFAGPLSSRLDRPAPPASDRD